MDLRTKLLELLAPLVVGDEVAPGVRLRGASDEVGPRLVFEIDGTPLYVEVAPIEAGTPAAATSARLRFAYVGAAGTARTRGLEVCRAVARRAAGSESAILEGLARDGALDHGGATRLREVRVDRLLEEAWHDGRRYHTLSPYVGCLVGCRFCYAQSHVALTRRLAGRAPAPWGSYVDVRTNAAEVLARELDEQDVRVVKLCPIVSDPYQAVEVRAGITRACLETMTRARRPPVPIVLTRARLVERDTALLAGLRARVGFSLPTLDDAVRAHFEPRAASIPERLEVLGALGRAGVETFGVVQPLLPGPLDALVDALAEHCASVTLDVLRGTEGAAGDFADPRFAHATDDGWQAQRAAALEAALRARGVPVWRELPPGVMP
jgi:DNA repair photolyase